MNENFSQRLKRLRKAAGITQSELAEKLNVHLQTVSKWERDVSRPDLSVLGGMASLLNVSLEELLGCPPSEGGLPCSGVFNASAEGLAISRARKDAGRSQEELAASLGVSADIVSKWERGVVCPDIEQLCALSAQFSLPVSRLYYGLAGQSGRPACASASVRGKRSLVPAALAALLLCALLVCIAVIVPALGRKQFVVVADGREYTVSQDDWFSLPDPQREGYDFLYYAADDGSPVTFPVKVGGNASLTAVYSPREYTIDYWLNGGSFLSSATTVFTVESGGVTLPELTKPGSSFEGWYLTPDFSGEPVHSVSCAADDISVYAKWDNTVYTVKYELQGGTMSLSNPQTITAESEQTLSEPVRRGYIFLGWFTGPSGGTRYYSVGGENAANLTLYAVWQQSGDAFNVLYDTCGGSLLGENPVSVGAGEVCELYGAQKAGHTFVGWNTSPDGSGKYYDGLYGISCDLTLYAVYAPNTYTVVYRLNGGTYYAGESNPNSVRFGQSITLYPAAKAGHTFVGWFTSREGGEQVVELNSSNILSLSTLYACFTPDVYTVSLNADGGEFAFDGNIYAVHSFNVTFGCEVELPECTLAGYDFCGWFDCEGNLYESINVLNVGNLSLTARYREAGLTYDIVYNLSGGINDSRNPQKVALGQTVRLNQPSRQGYIFLGWNTSPAGDGEYIECTPADQTETLVLYAVWQEIVVSGSARHFSYEMGQSSVSVTDYSGPYGDNVNIVIPSYIEGKPVVAVKFSSRSDDVAEVKNIKSLTIPSTVQILGECAFARLCIAEPVLIPASVSQIGENCFYGSQLSVEFKSGGALKEVGDYAFANAYFMNTVVLPQGVRAVMPHAFSGATLFGRGIILPYGVTYIGGYALVISGSGSEEPARAYLPSSVNSVEPYAFGSGDTVYVYASFSREQTQAFSPLWDNCAQVEYVGDEEKSVTLDCGTEKNVLAGNAFALPVLNREGCTFLGWVDGEGMLVNMFYVPSHDAVLTPLFEQSSVSDGRGKDAPAVLTAEKVYEFIVFSSADFYFKPNISAGQRFIPEFEYTVENCEKSHNLLCMSADYSAEYISGVAVKYGGGVLCFSLAGNSGTSEMCHGCAARVTVTLRVV